MLTHTTKTKKKINVLFDNWSDEKHKLCKTSNELWLPYTYTEGILVKIVLSSFFVTHQKRHIQL